MRLQPALLRTAIVASVSLSVTTLLPAQAASAPPASSESTVVLSPFNVTSEKDEGFVAANSLAGGRMKTDLKDTPLAYSVMTRDFLDALNLFDLREALAWTVGVQNAVTDVTNSQYFSGGDGSGVISRGVGTNGPQRNFFKLGFNTDSYNEERIDFIRGPNALLVGTNSQGGSAVIFTKQARTDRTFASFLPAAGSWNKYRAAIDVNYAVNDKLALRVNWVSQKANTWRDLEFKRSSGQHLTGTYRPFKHTTVRVETEAFKVDALSLRESMTDAVSGWDGKTVVAAPTAAIANSDSLGLVRKGSSTAPYLVYVPSADRGTVMNWANTWTTQGGGANASVPVAGVLPLSTSNLGISNGNFTGDIFDPAARLSLAIPGARGSLGIPTRRTVGGPTTPTLFYRLSETAAYLEHQQGEHFFFEAGAHVVSNDRLTNYIVARGANQIQIDLNQTLPNGAANPNFLQPYGDAQNAKQHFDTFAKEGRASLAAVFNHTRWGDFSANVIVGTFRSEDRIYRFADVFNRDPDIRRRSLADWYNYRFYFNHPAPLPTPDSIKLVDPIAGTTADYKVSTDLDLNSTTNNRGVDTKYNYGQAALNAKLWHGKIVLLGGVRRDSYETFDRSVIGNAAALINDYPANWNGRDMFFRPTGPADYFSLTYVPKDANGAPTGPAVPALSRPRVNGVPLAQYAKDHFRDDYSAPEVKFDITTKSYGGVFHVLRWLSAYANYAETFVPPTSGLTLGGGAIPPGTSHGTDEGVRFNLFGGRIVASIGHYKSAQVNNFFDSSSSTRKYQNIVSANVVGDLTSNGTNKRGLPELPTPTFDFFDNKTNGYEMDTVANLTSNWRLLFNASRPKVQNANSGRDEDAYLAANEGKLKQIVIDAGGLIDANNVATVDTSIPVDNRSPDVTAAVQGWNDIQTYKRTHVPGAVSPSNQPSYTANLFTDYKFSSGVLKNVRIGGGVQAIGPKVIGNRGGDTIRNPANPNTAVDDPNVDVNTLIKMSGYRVVTATLGYERRLSDKVMMRVNLSITNLLNNTNLIYTGVGLRPPGGDISRPDRVSVPTSFYYRAPRAFALSSKFSF